MCAARFWSKRRHTGTAVPDKAEAESISVIYPLIALQKDFLKAIARTYFGVPLTPSMRNQASALIMVEHEWHSPNSMSVVVQRGSKKAERDCVG